MINSYTGFQPLKEVWLGDTFDESWAAEIFDQPEHIRAFERITQETRAQLDYFQSVLEADGIRVRRPHFPTKDAVNFDEYAEFFTLNGDYRFRNYKQWFRDHRTAHCTKPQLNPRDDFIVYGKTLYCVTPRSIATAWWRDTLNEYIANGYDVRFYDCGPLEGSMPPSVVRLGQDVILEDPGYPSPYSGQQTLARHFEAAGARCRVVHSPDSRHADGQLSVLKPGLLLSSVGRQAIYNDTFPGWKVILAKEEWTGLSEEEKQAVNDIRFQNQEVYDQLKPWIGDITESFFDVNVLVRDPNHVYVINEPPQAAAEMLEAAEMTYTVIPWKYRWFWDGGLHCITLDVERTGKGETYV